MEQLDIFQKMGEIGMAPPAASQIREMTEHEKLIQQHKIWLKEIRRERPSTERTFRIGVYIRYFNQTKYENYLDFHKKQYIDTISLCPRWSLVDFYIDSGSTAPSMGSSLEWNRLLDDCMNNKIDLILTQKISNVSRHPFELTFCARMLAAHEPPIGIYFISEDIFTLASYYMEDLKDPYFFPTTDWLPLPDDTTEQERSDE